MPPELPARLPYTEGQGVPTGYHLGSRPRKSLLVSGTVVFAIPYGIAVTETVADSRGSDSWLLIPVAGPFLELAARDCSTSCNDRPFLVLAGIGEITGAALFFSAFLLPEKILVRDDLGGRAERPKVAWSVAPLVGGTTGSGLAFLGVL